METLELLAAAKSETLASLFFRLELDHGQSLKI